MGGRKEPEQERREAILRACYAVAARERLTGVTARAVATEAGVSSGLIFFYFESIDNLLVELLDWLLDRTIVGIQHVEGVAGAGDATTRLVSAVARDLRRLPRQREQVELFFDYWVLGTRKPAIRRKIRRALEHYAAAFVPIAGDVIASDARRFAATTPEGLAGVIANFIIGCSLQIVTDPSRFDLERTLATVETFVGSLPGVAAPSLTTADIAPRAPLSPDHPGVHLVR